ncbi:MAG: HipA domain-containing protein [Collinsella sp.]
MKTARRVGIPTANVSYYTFEDEAALVVERYDRMVNSSGNIERLHQEDFCQALGVLPSQKYTADGGPTTRDIQERLINTVPNHMNLVLFTYMLFYNAIIGAPDAHAKNYSLILGKGTNAALAPMYDVASGLAYERMRRKARLAMSVGGENRVGRIGPGAIRRYHGMGDPRWRRRSPMPGHPRSFALRPRWTSPRGAHLHGRGHGRIRRPARHGGPARAYAWPRPRKLPAPSTSSGQKATRTPDYFPFFKQERGHRRNSGAPSRNVICNPLARGSDCCLQPLRQQGA